MNRILVTGSGGQLGKCLQLAAGRYPEMHFKFYSRAELDITKIDTVTRALEQGNYNYFINAAAYTNVDEAERNPESAYSVNARAVEYIAKLCRERNVILIHISTDYVFDGEKKTGYTTEDAPNPINVYGQTKLAGEQFIQATLRKYFIIRTSWLYSEFGDNFYVKVLAKAKNGETLYITDRQVGCPTQAEHLAEYILSLIHKGSSEYGIHHFTDGKAMTWYEFARDIIRENNLDGEVKVVRDNNYRSFAARPKNSVLIIRELNK